MKTRAPFLYQVAEFISSAKFTDFGADVIHQANRVIADTVGAAYSGVRTDAFQRALKSKNEIFGDGVFEIWGTDQSSVLSGAIFYNALAISSTDFDEGHRKAVGHPASLVVPTALVLGKSLGLPSLEIRKAVIIGYEVATRFSNARYKEKITNYASGRWGACSATGS